MLLQKEFPALKFARLPAYHPRYPGRGGSMSWAMASQLPHFIKVIAAEHRAIETMVRRESIGLVISDNRYGCWSQQVPSVFITHQHNILMPKRFGWLQGLVRRLNERLMNRFDICWIPDFPAEHAMAGTLVARAIQRLKTDVRYIGWLSRFVPRPAVPPRYDVTLILSGPEPQRTLLEEVVLPQLQSSDLRYRVVRGLPSAITPSGDSNVVNFLTSAALQDCIEASEVIIARSGYSTIMDMHALGKKVIFVPTPGQTEQEYLAETLESEGIAYYARQDAFDLATAMREHKRYSGFASTPTAHLLAERVSEVLNIKF